MDDALLKKLAVNEALLRDVNEAIERGLRPGNEEQVVRFRCECAQLECNQAVVLTVSEYESVRANPRRFVLIDGHERGEVAVVVDRLNDYVVVEKLGDGAAVAEERDPRS
ncbi:MAG TPA: hypothetical protein VGF70_08455 [Solirubrobacteraceae bacterium]|jgi:hypothetical protein